MNLVCTTTRVLAGMTLILALLATCQAQPSFTVTPTSIAFAPRTVGTVSLSQYINLTNTGTKSLTVSGYAVTPTEFPLFTGWAPQTVGPGKSTSFTIRFAPDGARAFSGSFTITVDGAAPVVIPLTGTGQATGAVAELSQTEIAFGNQAAGTTSAAKQITVSNAGTSKMTVNAVTVDPPFEVSGFSGATVLEPGASLSFDVSVFGTLPAYYTNSATVSYDVLSPSGLTLSATITPATALEATNYPTLSSATVSSPYLANLTAAGGVPPYTWAMSSGTALPKGLMLSRLGSITGNLDASVTTGNYSFSVQVSDSGQPRKTATEALTLPVAALTGAVCSNIVTYIGNSHNPLIALTDLGTGTYFGKEGGLYPNGSNVRPPQHDAAGVSIAKTIQPLDGNGNPDPNGKYALMSVGSSAPWNTFLQFMPDAYADPSINPHLVFVPGAQPQAYAADLAKSDSAFWNAIFESFLPQSGVTANQVVAVWFQDVDRTASGAFPSNMITIQNEYETIAQNLHSKFPNLKLMYLNSKIYGGYSPGSCPEPFTYELSFAVKWAVQTQIDGSPSLNYDARRGPVMAPWMSWASYDWTNGLQARADGLTWTCPDTLSDGCHPSNPAGREKESNLLLNFFKTDDTASPWFLAH